MLKCRVLQPRSGDDRIELIVAQVVRNRHALQLGLAALDLHRGLIKRDVQRHCRAVASLHQRVGLHHIVRQHRDLVAGHINRGQARAAQLVDRAAGQHGQAGRSDVDADGYRTSAKPLHRQRVVDFRGLRIVNREGLHCRYGKLIGNRGGGDGWEARALGKVLQQEAFPVELVRRSNRTCFLQQVQRRQMGRARGFNDGLVFWRVLVGLEQDFVQLEADGFRAFPSNEFVCPLRDLRDDLLFLLDGDQCLRNDVGGRLFEAAFAGAAKVVG